MIEAIVLLLVESGVYLSLKASPKRRYLVTYVVLQKILAISVVVRQVAVRPAPAFFQFLRQVPVINRAEGSHAVGEHRIRQSAVVVDPLHVRRARSGWLNAWP